MPRDGYRRARHIDCGSEVTALLTAGGAVAGIWLRKVALNGYLDGFAQT
ncbi:hypothetical protein SULPSESMR1_00131 [Pseudosulfitobacter pseudonitzschiae]|uniref:Uncharacterized protein n=1 Tax=Pseudosulfitobacter pseudonitzschiae TaxID=1402135 RepID=A0A221JWG7_9RHOB|nr:hypothetical protein SULPSESMR1_00131 [Pseudosulfitobacter pseudonitzschiae]